MVTSLERFSAEYRTLGPSAPIGPHGVGANWRADTPCGAIWRSWSAPDYASALWGDSVPTVIITNTDARNGSGPAGRSHEVVPASHGLRLVVGTQTGVIDQPRIRFVFDPRASTRRGQIVRARLGDAEWTMRLWRSSTIAVDRDHHRIAQAQGKRRWELDPAADPLDLAVALALLTSVSSAAHPIW